MPILENPKHEAFAQHLSRGLKQGKAYAQAGYTANAAAASRLSKESAVVERVSELKQEMAEKVGNALTTGDPTKINLTLTEMGLNMSWVAQSFKSIYEEALAAGQFAPANTAVANIQKIIELESGSDTGALTDSDSKISVKDVTAMLKEVKEIAQLPAPNTEPEIVDVTPPVSPRDFISDNAN